jgi:hypothetical protein
MVQEGFVAPAVWNSAGDNIPSRDERVIAGQAPSAWTDSDPHERPRLYESSGAKANPPVRDSIIVKQSRAAPMASEY